MENWKRNKEEKKKTCLLNSIMLEGWYCRSLANEAAAAEEEERMVEESKFKKEYKYLKRKFQNLVYVSTLKSVIT